MRVCSLGSYPLIILRFCLHLDLSCLPLYLQHLEQCHENGSHLLNERTLDPISMLIDASIPGSSDGW